MNKIYLVLLLIFVYINVGKAQQFSDAQIKTALINKFVQNIEWQNELSLENFTLAVYGPDTSLIPYFRQLAATKKIKEKTINVKLITDFSQLKSPYPQLLYVSNSQNYEIEDIFDKLQNENTLLVSDDCKDQKFVMINFIYKDDKSISFEVNKKTIEEQGLTILPKLLLLGGTEINIRELYSKQEEELKLEKEKVEKQKEELLAQQTEIESQKTLILQQKTEVEKQQLFIEKQQQEILKQKDTLAQVLLAVKAQESKLVTQLKLMDEQKKNILTQQELIDKQNKEVEERNKVLDNLNTEIEKQQNLIGEQTNVLSQKEGQIETQKKFLLMLISFVALILVLLFFIFRSNRIKKRINKQLEEKNIAIQAQNKEIQAQKEEIQLQATELSKVNVELEKLSIVASETDNAVIIMDSEGNFEWVNDGFTRLYGYDIGMMKIHFGTNIRTSSKKENIIEIVDNCINKKRTEIYQNIIITKKGESKWVQTTLTPILDEYGKVYKIVAIDSDISKLKEAEQEIYQKNEELIAQRDEMAAQKDYIEFQNLHIRSSINYAKTIQRAILPPLEEIEKYYDTFVLYKPKDIVSGDFYWFTTLEISDKKYNFIAVVDCTGHGVPGAFMSMIASRLLNEIVLETKTVETFEILNKLNKAVRNALRQDKSDNSDGMDLCLCRIENIENEFKIQFTGAKRPLYYYSKKENSLKELKGDRKSIGGYLAKRSSQEFTSQNIVISKEDILYLSTDGYIDQSGMDRKRLGSPKFLETVEAIMSKPLNEQKNIIEKVLAGWQGENDQRDDITILGLKMK